MPPKKHRIENFARNANKIHNLTVWAKWVALDLIGARDVSKKKRKKLTKALLKTMLRADEENIEVRIKAGLCFGCGKFQKPKDVYRFYWLCPKCELKHLGETQTSTATIISASNIQRRKKDRHKNRYSSTVPVSSEEEFTVINGALFVEDDDTVQVFGEYEAETTNG